MKSRNPSLPSNSAKDNISSKVLLAVKIIREAYCSYRVFYIQLGQLILHPLTNTGKIYLICQLAVRIPCAKIALASRFVSAAWVEIDEKLADFLCANNKLDIFG